MSALIFHTDETQAFIATDTLATRDGVPAFFTTKAFALPHLRMVVATTGVAGFLDHWLRIINSSPFRDIEDLNEYAPGILAPLWAELKALQPSIEDQSTTVYHFGFPDNSDTITRFMYTSSRKFVSEQLPAVGFKPECMPRDGYTLPKDIPPMMNEQRSIQAAEPEENRVHIGGEMQVIHLTKAGFHIYCVAQFDDFEAQSAAIQKGRVWVPNQRSGTSTVDE